MGKETSTFLLYERFFFSSFCFYSDADADAVLVVVITSIQRMLIVALCFDYIKIYISPAHTS